MRKFVASVAMATAFVVGGLLGAPANASTLIGDTITIDYLAPTIGTPVICCGFPANTTVVAGISDAVTDSYFNGPPPLISIDPESSSIIFSWLLNIQSDNGSPFEGFKVSGINDTVVGISTVGFADSRVTFDGHDIWVNFGPTGTQWTAGAYTVNLEFATPLPAALPLFATGLGAMGLLGWRRKRKKNAAAFAAA